VAAFAAVLLALAVAVSLQVQALRGMDAILGTMEEHERLVSEVLGLGEAVRDARLHAGGLARGEQTRAAAYQQARARAQESFRKLEERLPSPEATALLGRAREASDELDRCVREEVTPALGRGDPSAAGALEGRLVLAGRVERDIESLLRLLQGALFDARRALDQIHERTALWTRLLLAALPVLVAGAGLYLWRSIAGPLARLGEGAARVARGDLHARIPVGGADEFRHLAMEFNAMTAALRQHQERLVESEKLAGIGRLAAGIAHEINNPLQVMLGYLSLHRDHPDRVLAEQLAAVEDETLRCKGIVDDLLELSRPAALAVPVDLRALCDQVIDRLRASARPEPSELSVEGVGVAVADPPRVRQVLHNLVKNALEAAGPRGRVRVRVGPCSRGVEVSVADTGPGVPAECRDRLFEPFCTGKVGGTGLGLAVSRAIARAHGGDVDLASSEPGGAVFRLWLPGLERRA